MEAEAEEMVFEDAGRDRASRKAHSLQKLEKPGSGFSPRTSKGMSDLQNWKITGSGFSPRTSKGTSDPQNWKIIGVFSFRPLRLLQFLTGVGRSQRVRLCYPHNSFMRCAYSPPFCR